MGSAALRLFVAAILVVVPVASPRAAGALGSAPTVAGVNQGAPPYRLGIDALDGTLGLRGPGVNDPTTTRVAQAASVLVHAAAPAGQEESAN